MFDFKTQLKTGDNGEAVILAKYPGKLQKYSGREYDFDCLETGHKIEVKTDTYPMEKTPNFFMERYSDNFKQTNGGPWRACADNIDIFLYYFATNGNCFRFTNLKELTERLDRIVVDQKLRPMFIKNKAWTTSGYKINRNDISDLYDILVF